jgi:hypothetical protein
MLENTHRFAIHINICKKATDEDRDMAMGQLRKTKKYRSKTLNKPPVPESADEYYLQQLIDLSHKTNYADDHLSASSSSLVLPSSPQQHQETPPLRNFYPPQQQHYCVNRLQPSDHVNYLATAPAGMIRETHLPTRLARTNPPPSRALSLVGDATNNYSLFAAASSGVTVNQQSTNLLPSRVSAAVSAGTVSRDVNISNTLFGQEPHSSFSSAATTLTPGMTPQYGGGHKYGEDSTRMRALDLPTSYRQHYMGRDPYSSNFSNHYDSCRAMLSPSVAPHVSSNDNYPYYPYMF